MKKIIFSLLAYSICFSISAAQAAEVGALSLGEVTSDGKYVLIDCGELAFSKWTKMNVCGFTATVINLSNKDRSWFEVAGHNAFDMADFFKIVFPYAYSSLTDGLVSNNGGFIEGDVLVRTIKFSYFDFKDFVIMPETPLFEVSAVLCPNIITNVPGQIISVCWDATEVFLVKYHLNSKKLERFTVMALPPPANLEIRYPNFVYDDVSQNLVVGREEYLGGGWRTLPEGYFDLKSNTFFRK